MRCNEYEKCRECRRVHKKENMLERLPGYFLCVKCDLKGYAIATVQVILFFILVYGGAFLVSYVLIEYCGGKELREYIRGP